MHDAGTAVEEGELSMQKERDMVSGQELDKLGAGLLQDILQALGMKLRRHRMATVLALKEHNGQQMVYPPSCSSGRHKKTNEGMTRQQKTMKQRPVISFSHQSA